MLVLLHVDAPLFWRCGVDEMKTAARILISLLSVVVWCRVTDRELLPLSMITEPELRIRACVPSLFA